MKENRRIILAGLSIILSFCSMFMFIGCVLTSKLDYYSREENYVSATGKLVYFAYNEDKDTLYLEFNELSPKFDDNCFKIVGDSLLTVQENGIDQKIILGDTVEFVTAPKYFGDGYVMPIVAISVNGEVLLDFELSA